MAERLFPNVTVLRGQNPAEETESDYGGEARRSK